MTSYTHKFNLTSSGWRDVHYKGWFEMIAHKDNMSLDLKFSDETSTDTNMTNTIDELEYIADMSHQLYKMSNGLGENTLSHLFEMVIIEIGLQLDVEKYKVNTLNI